MLEFLVVGPASDAQTTARSDKPSRFQLCVHQNHTSTINSNTPIQHQHVRCSAGADAVAATCLALCVRRSCKLRWHEEEMTRELTGCFELDLLTCNVNRLCLRTLFIQPYVRNIPPTLRVKYTCRWVCTAGNKLGCHSDGVQTTCTNKALDHLMCSGLRVIAPTGVIDFGQFRLQLFFSTSANFDFGQFRLRAIRFRPIFGC